MPTYPELAGRTVLITGGANGIGEATVRAYHAQGARVVFCDREADAGTRLAAELGESVAFARVDLTREAEVRKWIDGVAGRHGPIHALVNNAACDPRIPLGETTAEAWDNLFALNLRAYFLTARFAAPRMPAGAAIVNLGSITFHAGPANMSAYVATKGGVVGLTRSLARELGARRIRVNAVSPGWVMTERQLRQYVTPAVKRFVRKTQCIPELLQPGEIANVIVFLTSDASSAITGQEILAERGWVHD